MTGAEMMELVETLYPIHRSITGAGVRQTLKILSEINPLEIHEVPTGAPALDWSVPREWNVREAWIRDPQGRRVVDLRDSNLHLMGYSVPIHETLPLDRLLPHLHSLEDHPDWIPWRTSYYADDWGFCLPHAQRETLAEGDYEVFIDSTLEAGHLTYAEFFLPGRVDEELLVSVHICHPSLVNDNLTGIAVSTAVACALRSSPHRLGIRFVYLPGTIGALTWLERNRDVASRCVGGLTLTCLGDASHLTYKRTYDGAESVDRAAHEVLTRLVDSHEEIDFIPFGYDERQYNSPGFRMPIGSLMRSRHGQFPEYHTSADNLSILSVERLEESAAVVLEILMTLDRHRRFRSLAPAGEPQLGRRGLYRAMGGGNDPESRQFAMLWLLQMGDGSQTLLDVAHRSDLPMPVIEAAATDLEEHQLLTWC